MKSINWDRHNRNMKRRWVQLQPLCRRGATEHATDRDEDMGRLADITDSRGQPISMPKLRFLGDQP